MSLISSPVLRVLLLKSLILVQPVTRGKRSTLTSNRDFIGLLRFYLVYRKELADLGGFLLTII